MSAEAYPSGIALASEIDQAASVLGMTAARLVEPLTNQPHSFLNQLRRARKPSAATVQRVRDLLRGGDGIKADVDREAKHAIERRAIARRQSIDTPLTVPGRATDEMVNGRMAVDRDPCFRCGTRADIGCRHRPRTVK